MTSKLFVADIQSCCNHDGQCIGHFIPLARLYSELFAADFDVAIVGGPVYAASIKTENIITLPHDCKESDSNIRHLFDMVANARTLFKKSTGETVILQYGKPFSNHLAILLSNPKCKLFLIQYANTGISNWVQKMIWKMIRHKVTGIICPSDKVGQCFGVPYCAVPDYIYTSKDYQRRQKVAIPEIKYDFCLVGRISEEKGIVEVAQRLAGTKYRVVIAGKTQTASLEHNLRKACEGASNIDLRIGYVSDEDYQDILAHSRYTILNYQGEYSRRSSGVVFDTLFAGVPVIGQRCAALQFIEDYEVGCIYGSLDNLSEGFLDSLLDEETINGYKMNIDKYRDTHIAYKDKLIKFISQK